MPESLKTIKIFVAYSPSHQDEQLKQLLAKQLETLQNKNVVVYWYQHPKPEQHKKSLASENGKNLSNFAPYENFHQLHTADIIVLLVSGDFLTLIQNQVDWNSEIIKLKEKHELGEIVAIPILLDRIQGWQNLLGNFTPLPKNGMPVQSWQSHDAAFKDIFRGIEAVVEEIRTYQERLQEYKSSVSSTIQQEFPLSSQAVNNLNDIKKYLAIKDADSQLIEQEIITQAKQEYSYKLQQYKQELIHFLKNKKRLANEDRRNLQLIQQYLGLKNEDIIKIEQSVISKKTTKDIRNIFAIGYNCAVKISAIALIMASAASIAIFVRIAANHAANKTFAQAEIKFDKGDYQGAVHDFTQVMKTQPHNIDVYIGRGNALTYLKNYQAAIQDYTKVINMPAESPVAYMNRAVVNCSLGDKQAAKQDYQKAVIIYKELGALNEMQQAKARLNNLQKCAASK
ncbi:tetratricopeptide repeat protein [Calothrix sp. UHCC 0171]|uniref:tetratricopeptide repeat protein n=1 Tax=Calothrix sp. UHCC 0171 TaxID=3110245 RepID=UPI002B1EFDAD|nr:tetratricopeptide repeat protein [Calothrix sp. UHCC 0171]MEA5572183.1 tetratricopeptide repeat protein [Calothrix sp. UHCC 0171]